MNRLEGCHCGKPCTGGVRNDIVRIARNRDNSVTIEQPANDLGVH
jgi:hypothetical protein